MAMDIEANLQRIFGPQDALLVQVLLTPQEIVAAIFQSFAEIVGELGMTMEKVRDGELIVHTGWTYDDDLEQYREMTEEESTG